MTEDIGDRDSTRASVLVFVRARDLDFQHEDTRLFRDGATLCA